MSSVQHTSSHDPDVGVVQRAYIGLGSNLKDPVSQVARAIAELTEIPSSRFVSASSLYRSVPLEGEGVPAGQPEYVNAVAAIDTRLSALQLLSALQTIEQQHGRQRGQARWAPRTLDLDLLLYGQNIINHEQLIIPHPGLVERNFVLYPLAEIVPDLVLPVYGPLVEVLAGISSEGLQRLG